MGRRHHYHVYVVELADAVWNEPRFRRANPDHQLGKPFVYVGMTGTDPDLRFDKHKAGVRANRYVQQYGLRLLVVLVVSTWIGLGVTALVLRLLPVRPDAEVR